MKFIAEREPRVIDKPIINVYNNNYPIPSEKKAVNRLNVGLTDEGFTSPSDGASMKNRVAKTKLLTDKTEPLGKSTHAFSPEAEILKVKSNDELLMALSKRMGNLPGLSHVSIGILEGSNAFRIFLFDPASKSKTHPEYHRLSSCSFPLDQVLTARILNSRAPIYLNLISASENGNSLPLYARINKESGIKQLIACRLVLKGKVLGFLMFFFENSGIPTKSQMDSMSGLAQYVSSAVTDIVSNQNKADRAIIIKKIGERPDPMKIKVIHPAGVQQSFSGIIGNGGAIHTAFHLIARVSPSDSTVLILGETGTGKELIARAIHNNSSRKNKPLVKVNCAALPANLIESELFGHERGSFTGATERRLGKFEQANGGTLFLDEIGDMPLDLQVKLLRALQEREIERVGGRGPIKVDLRIIAATNRDLEKEMMEGRFRSDLYYRLNIFPISVPALRERPEDIEPLLIHFIEKYNKKCNRSINAFSTNIIEDLKGYSWPGNIRELEHLIERTVILTEGTTMLKCHIPKTKAQPNTEIQSEQIILRTLDQNERDHIYKILKYCGGKISGNGGAAEILGIPPSTLNSKIKRLGIKRLHTINTE